MKRMENGYIRIGGEVAVLAAEDLRTLVEKKIIVDGRVTPRWPKERGGNIRVLHHYDNPQKVLRLIDYWVSGEADNWLGALDTDITAKTIVQKYNLKGTVV